MDQTGALYGTNVAGGAGGRGVIYKLFPPAAGQSDWTLTVLHAFTLDEDGFYPKSPLIMDASGVLYGTTSEGGRHGKTGYGYGVAFRLTPPATGGAAWQYQVLHRFDAADDGYSPAGLSIDASGALYGVTRGGGRYGGGVAFRLTPPAPGSAIWTEAVLHRFGKGVDGRHPTGVMRDAAGALYGTTLGGGSSRYGSFGTIFRLVPPPAGDSVWRETILHEFADEHGIYPAAGLVMDSGGALYGTTTDTSEANAESYGTAYRLTPPASGTSTWSYAVLYSFPASADGIFPQAGIVMDKAGTLYSTTYRGGAKGQGVLFGLAPPGAGQTAWTEFLLSSFGDGLEINQTGLVMDGAGALYGSSAAGGTDQDGRIYRVTP